MSYPVKVFHHGNVGAPQLSNAWGCMTAVLDACLVDGFNPRTITLLERVGTVATATAATHGYEVGQIVLVDGAVPEEYNGEQQVLSITTNTFTYAVSDTLATPATGTITSKVAFLGFEKVYSSGSKRAYRSKNPESNRPFLRVDDGLDPAWTTTYAKYAKVTMAQGMSDIDTFVGQRAPYDPSYPTKNEIGTGSGTTAYGGWFKWYYAQSNADNDFDNVAPQAGNRMWTIVGDDRGFFLFNESIQGGVGGGRGGKCFTDFGSYRQADGFNTLLSAQESYIHASQARSVAANPGYNSGDWCSHFCQTGSTLGKVALRSYSQLGPGVPVSFTTLNTISATQVTGYSNGISWPNGPDYSLLLFPVLIKEGTHLRGKVPGMYWILNDAPGLQHLDKITGVAGYPGRTFVIIQSCNSLSGSLSPSAFYAFDITGPWY